MISIPDVLKDGSFRFIILKKRQKEPLETKWQLENNYSYDDSKLTSALKNGYNYGVICSDNDACILDADEYQRLKEIGALSLFEGQTLTVRTGNAEGERYHFYFKCSGLSGKKIPFFDLTDKTHLGEVYRTGSNAYCVGAGSIHPSGKRYEIVCNKPIKTIPLSDIKTGFLSKVKSSLNKQEAKQEETNQKPSQVRGIGFSDDLIIEKAERIFKDEFKSLLSGSSVNQGNDESKADYRFCSILSKFCDNYSQVANLLMKYRYRTEFDTNRRWKVQETALNAWNKNYERYNPNTGKVEKPHNPVNALSDDTSGIKNRDDRGKKPITHVKVYTYEPPEIQMEKVLTGLNVCNCPPSLFVRSGEMVRIITDEHGYPSIDPVKEIALRTRIYDCIEFLNKSDTKVRPPLDTIRDVIHGRGWVNQFPHITGVTDTPLIHPNGDILSEPGYDEVTGLYYSPSPGLVIPPIPLKPTKEDVQKAVKTIWEPFKEFSFVNKADGTHVLAGLISIVCRNLIEGNIPILLIDKPTPGTGASLISQIFGLISEGRDPAINSMPASEEEWKKQIISLLINGRPSVILDNIEGKLKSPALAALLTTQEYSDRLLGTNENVTYAHRIVWIGNGNNITLGGDLPRRSYWSRMDSESVRPWMDDKKYKHPDLRKWVIDNRGEILAGILTITRSWIQAEKPKPKNKNTPKIGGFEQWRDLIGGILEHVDIEGFLGNLEKMYDTTDTETPQWDLFVEMWYNTFKEEPQTTSEVFKAITPIKSKDGYTFCNHQVLRDSLPEIFLDVIEREGSFTRMLGSALSKRKDRRYPSGFKIKNAGEKKRAVRWKVEKVEKQSKFKPEDTR